LSVGLKEIANKKVRVLIGFYNDKFQVDFEEKKLARHSFVCDLENIFISFRLFVSTRLETINKY